MNLYREGGKIVHTLGCSLRALCRSLCLVPANHAARQQHVVRHGGSLQRPAVAVALLVAEFARARVALTGYLAGQAR